MLAARGGVPRAPATGGKQERQKTHGDRSEPQQRAAAPAQLRGLLLLDDALHSVPPGRVEDAPSADPEGDVVCFSRRAIRDEVA